MELLTGAWMDWSHFQLAVISIPLMPLFVGGICTDNVADAGDI